MPLLHHHRLDQRLLRRDPTGFAVVTLVLPAYVQLQIRPRRRCVGPAGGIRRGCPREALVLRPVDLLGARLADLE